MAYAHGIKWTDELIEIEIKKVMKALNIERMPSRSEMELIRKDASLSAKIGKCGGFRYWAKKLGLEIKESATSKGWEYEEKALDELELRGYDVKKMTTKHPYDLLVSNIVKVDVKVASRYYYEKSNYYHTFNLERSYHAFDFILGYCLDDNGDIEKTLIIPTMNIMEINQISLGEQSSYDKYEGRWDLIGKHRDLIKELRLCI